MSFNREEYDQFVSQSPQGSVYCYSWWLDAVAPGEWSVAIVRKNGAIQAALPFRFKKKWGIARVSHPDLTPMMGVLLKPSHEKYSSQLSQQKDWMNELIEQLPKADAIDLNFHYSLTNWLPFYWRGFQQTTSYTYVLEDLSNEDRVWEELRGNIRTDVRKASKILTVSTERSFEDFLKIYEATFKRQNIGSPVPLEVMRRVEEVCKEKQCRQMFFACDAEGRVHGVVYLIWDEKSVYYLFGGGDPQLRSSGAQTLLVWEAIRMAGRLGKRFDFEGSMTESIETFFRGFGPRQMPLYRVYKESRKYQFFSFVQGLKRKVLS